MHRRCAQSLRRWTRHCAGRAAAQPEPWRVDPRDPKVKQRTAASVREHGFALLPRLLDPSALARLKGPLLQHTESVLGLLHSRRVELDVGSRACFQEVVLRSPGRLDVPCEFKTAPADVVALLQGLAESVLHPGDAEGHAACKQGFIGIVRAEPGCPPQLWHSDSAHSERVHVRPSLLNILVALEDVSADDGPTELLPGSQVLTNHLRPGAGFDAEIVYQNTQNSPGLIGSSAKPVAPAMPAGSALLFDDRLLHRGGGNSGPRPRDLAFFSFFQSSFEPTAYYEATRSLKSYNHVALAEAVRQEFPGLAGGPVESAADVVFADGASGSQLHASAISAMVEQLRYGTANVGGAYASSERVLRTVTGARAAVSDLLGCRAEEVVFGPSMTALTYHLARALRHRGLGPGDNVVLDPISHGANVWPWVQLAEACGAEVRWLPVAEGHECLLDCSSEALAAVVDSSTRLVAAGGASNGVGSVHDAATLCAAAAELSKGRALRFVDAVHLAPHARLDVAALGCDFLACSPYKFFGPHAGVLFGRNELLAELTPERLDCQDDGLPRPENCHMSRWELGTQNFEALAGVAAAVNYIAGLGERFGGAIAKAPRQERLDAAWRAVAAHEHELKVRFLEGAASIKGLRLLGVADPKRARLRTATFAVAKEGRSAQGLAEALCARNIWCTGGNHYAGFWSAFSGGLASNEEGMCRLGFLHYNTLTEVDRVLQALEES